MTFYEKYPQLQEKAFLTQKVKAFESGIKFAIYFKEIIRDLCKLWKVDLVTADSVYTPELKKEIIDLRMKKGQQEKCIDEWLSRGQLKSLN